MATLSETAANVNRMQHERAAAWLRDPDIYQPAVDVDDIAQAYWLELAVRRKLVLAGRYKREFCDDRIARASVEDEWQLFMIRAELARVGGSEKVQKSSDARERWRQMEAPLVAASLCQSPDGEALRYAERKTAAHLDPMQDALLDAFRNTDSVIETASQRVLILSAAAYQSRRQADDLRVFATIRPDVLKGTVFNTILTPPAAAVSDLWAKEPPKKSTPSQAVAMGARLGGGGVTLGPPHTRKWTNDSVFPENERETQQYGKYQPMRDSTLTTHCRMLKLAHSDVNFESNSHLQALYASYRKAEAALPAAHSYSISFPPDPHTDEIGNSKKFSELYQHPPGGWPATQPDLNQPDRDTWDFGWDRRYNGVDPPPGVVPSYAQATNTSYPERSHDPTIAYYPYTFWKRAAILGSRAALWRYAYLMHMLIRTGLADDDTRKEPGYYGDVRAGNAPRRPADLEPLPTTTGSLDVNLLQNELETIMRLSLGRPVFMDTHDADEEALFGALGHPGRIRAELFDQLFFNDATAHFTLDLNFWRSDALYTAGVKPQLRKLNGNAALSSRGAAHCYYYMTGVGRSMFYHDSFLVRAASQITSIFAHSLVAATLAHVPLTVFSYALRERKEGEPVELLDVLATYLSARFVGFSVRTVKTIADKAFKPQGRWQAVKTLGIYVLMAASPDLVSRTLGYNLRFQFAPEYVDYATMWASLRNQSGIPADHYRTLHPLAYRTPHEIEEKRNQTIVDVQREQRGKAEADRDARNQARLREMQNVTYSFVDTGTLPSRPLTIDASLLEVMEYMGADQLIWTHSDPLPRMRDKSHNTPIMRANYLNALASMRVYASDLGSDAFMQTVSANGAKFLETPTAWPRATTYFGIDLSTAEARTALVAQLAGDRDFVLHNADASEVGIEERMHASMKRLMYWAGEYYLERFRSIVPNIYVSPSNHTGAHRLAPILAQSSDDVRARISQLLNGNATLTATEAALLDTTVNEPDIGRFRAIGEQIGAVILPGWWKPLLPSAKMTKPADCFRLGGIVTVPERAQLEQSRLTTIPGSESARLYVPTDLERYCLGLFTFNREEEFRTDYPLPPPNVTNAQPPAFELPPTNLIEVDRRVSLHIAETAEAMQKKITLSIAANSRVRTWGDLGDFETHWKNYWDASVRQTTLTYATSFYNILLHGDYPDQGIDEGRAKQIQRRLDPSNPSDLAYFRKKNVTWANEADPTAPINATGAALMRNMTRPLNLTDPSDQRLYLDGRMVSTLIASVGYEAGPGYRTLATLQEYAYTLPVLEFYEEAHKNGFRDSVFTMPLHSLAQRINGESDTTSHTLTLIDNYVALASITRSWFGPWFTTGLRSARVYGGPNLMLRGASDIAGAAQGAAADLVDATPSWVLTLAVTLLAEVGFTWLQERKFELLASRDDLFQNELNIIDAATVEASNEFKLKRVRMVHALKARIAFNKLVGLVFSFGFFRNTVGFGFANWFAIRALELIPYGPSITARFEGIWPPNLATMQALIAEPNYTWLASAAGLALAYWFFGSFLLKHARKLGKSVPVLNTLVYYLHRTVTAFVPTQVVAIPPTLATFMASTASALSGKVSLLDDVTIDEVMAFLPTEQRAMFWDLVGAGGAIRPTSHGFPELNTPTLPETRPSTKTTQTIAFGGDEDAPTSLAAGGHAYPATTRVTDWQAWPSLLPVRSSVTVEEMEEEDEPLPTSEALLDVMMAASRGGNGNGQWGDGLPETVPTTETYMGLAL